MDHNNNNNPNEEDEDTQAKADAKIVAQRKPRVVSKTKKKTKDDDGAKESGGVSSGKVVEGTAKDEDAAMDKKTKDASIQITTHRKPRVSKKKKKDDSGVSSGYESILLTPTFISLYIERGTIIVSHRKY